MLLILAWLTPLAAAALAGSARLRWLAPVTAMPALAAAILVPIGQQIEVPWLLLGALFGLDDTGRIFLAFTAVLWLAAGLYAAGLQTGANTGRFRAFFLLAMAGNLLLIVAVDLISFYLGFALMGLASYGLVVHDGNRAALRAGKVYLVMTMVGELTLFVALVLIADHAGSLAPSPGDLAGLGDLAVGLLLFGLAIKAGLFPLHVWLPLAHPAAPVSASAVLSGAMIKVALLGWLRFLPIGQAPMTEWGLLLLLLGLVTMLYALPIGLVQSNPKVILAYSSVSKMGLISVTLGLILIEPGLASAGVTALVLYAAHHALAKGGLFLSVGLRHQATAQGLVLTGTLLLALSLAGVPGSSGAVAKDGIEPIFAAIGWSWVAAAMTLGAVGTTLLMARLLWVVWRIEPHPKPGWMPSMIGWGLPLVLSLAFALVLGGPAGWATNWSTLAAALTVIIPFTVVAWRRPGLLRPVVDLVPAGDLLVLGRPLPAVLNFVLGAIGRWWRELLEQASARIRHRIDALRHPPADPERALRAWPNAGASWLVITALLLLVTVSPAPGPRAPEATEADTGRSPAHQGAVSDNASAAQPTAASDAGRQVRLAPPTVVEPISRDEKRVALPSPGPRVAETREPQQGAAPETSRVSAGEAPERQVRSPPSLVVEPLPQADTLVALPSPRPRVAETSEPEAAATPDTSEGDAGIAETLNENPEPPCNLGQPFVLSHPQLAKPLKLADCQLVDGGPSPMVAPPLTNDLVLMVQHHLGDLGYDPGPRDGLIGPRTREALRRFQRDRDRQLTGVIDFALLRELRRAQGALPR